MTTTYIVDCPKCGAEMQIEEDAATLEAENGMVLECWKCDKETDFSFEDFDEADDDEEEDDDDDEGEPDPLTGEIEDLDDNDDPTV